MRANAIHVQAFLAFNGTKYNDFVAHYYLHTHSLVLFYCIEMKQNTLSDILLFIQNG